MQELDIVTGLSQRFVQEYEATVADVPTVTLEGPCNSYIGSLLFWSLFQSGTSTATVSGTNTRMTCVPYTDSAPEMYFSVVKAMVDPSTSMSVDTYSHYYTGAMVKTLTLSTEERMVVQYSAEVLGTGFNTASAGDFTNTAQWTQLAFPTKTTSWRWQDFTVEWATVAANVLNLNLTFTNNANAVYYNNDSIQGYKLGKMGVTGDFFIPWSAFTDGNDPVTKYEAGTDFGLEFYTTDGAGQDTTSNDVDIALNVKVTELESTGDVETGWNVNVEGLYDGTNAAMNVQMSYLTATLVRSVV